jgi:hypothetical protein
MTLEITPDLERIYRELFEKGFNFDGTIFRQLKKNDHFVVMFEDEKTDCVCLVWYTPSQLCLSFMSIDEYDRSIDKCKIAFEKLLDEDSIYAWLTANHF